MDPGPDQWVTGRERRAPRRGLRGIALEGARGWGTPADRPAPKQRPVGRVRCGVGGLTARFRLFLLVFLVMCACGAVPSPASAGEWPMERQFVLVEPPPPLHLSPPASSLAELGNGALLVLVYWPVV